MKKLTTVSGMTLFCRLAGSLHDWCLCLAVFTDSGVEAGLLIIYVTAVEDWFRGLFGSLSFVSPLTYLLIFHCSALAESGSFMSPTTTTLPGPCWHYQKRHFAFVCWLSSRELAHWPTWKVLVSTCLSWLSFVSLVFISAMTKPFLPFVFG